MEVSDRSRGSQLTILLVSSVSVIVLFSCMTKGNVELEQAVRLNKQVIKLYRDGRYQGAIPLAEQALAIREKALGPVHSRVGSSLNNLALLYKKLGDYGRAKSLYQRTLTIKKKALGSDHTDVAIALSNLANLYTDLGDYSRAEPLHQSALVIREKALGDEHPDVALSLNNLAALHTHLGDYSRAEHLHRKSLVIREKTLGPNHPDVAQSLNNLASLYSEIGDFGRAEPLFQRALTIEEKALGSNHPSVTITKANIGILYLQQGKLEEAYEFFKDYEWSTGHGSYYLMKGNYLQARDHFSKALNQLKKTRGSTHLLGSYIGLGLSMEGLGRYLQAVDLYHRAVEIMEEQRAALSPAKKTHFLKGKVGADFKRIEAYDGLVRVKEKLKDSAGAFLWSEYTKARLLLDALVRGKTAPGLPAAVAQKEQALTMRLAGLYRQRDATFAKSPTLFEKIEKDELPRTKNDLARFVEELRRNYPVYAAIKYPQPMSVAQLPLQSHEALIAYEVTQDQTFAWLIRGATLEKAIAIPITRTKLAARVKKYRGFFEGITSPTQLAGFDPRVGQELYALLIKDFVSNLREGEPIIVIPDEILGVLPFEALVVRLPAKVKMGTGKHGLYPKGIGYLADFYSIRYYQSATAFAIARTLKGTEDKTGENMLVVADPVFELSDERLTGRKTMLAKQYENQFRLMRAVSENWQQDKGPASFPRLQFTGRLAERLTRIYGKPVDPLSGMQATEQELRSRSLKRYRYQVFATHGILDNEVAYIQEPALMLCQVGADAKNREKDGFLTMTEVMDLKLNADVAALTACNSGVGKNLAGEGVMGMGRAFQYAGAKSVLMSLWSVEDESTNLLTERFFNHLNLGKDKLEALRLARADIREDGYEHPFFWAPFILVGER